MERLAQFFKALSDETRLRIMVLLTHGELCVCDVMEVLGEPQSKVSRHLAYLKHSGLTNSRRVGVWMHYWLKDPEDEIHKAHMDFLKEKMAPLPQFREDEKKLVELKKQGSCRAMLRSKAVQRSRAYTGRREIASSMRRIRRKGGS